MAHCRMTGECDHRRCTANEIATTDREMGE